MTNYNSKQNIERQLALPGMETSSIENIASASPKPRPNINRFKLKAYSLLGAIVLGIAGTGYYAINETLKTMDAVSGIGNELNIIPNTAKNATQYLFEDM